MPNEEAAKKTRKEMLREKLLANIKVVRELIPDYPEPTDEKIDEWLSDKRIKQHDDAVALEKKNEKMLEYITRFGPRPKAFSRVTALLLDWSGTPEAEAYNEKVCTLLSATTNEGQEFRKEMMAKVLNSIESIEQLNEASFDEKLEYAMANVQKAKLGHDTKNTVDQIVDMGFDISKEEKEALIIYGQTAGIPIASSVQVAASDYFLTMPPLFGMGMMKAYPLLANAGRLKSEHDLPPKPVEGVSGENAPHEMGNFIVGSTHVSEPYEKIVMNPHNYTKDSFEVDPEKTKKFFRDFAQTKDYQTWLSGEKGRTFTELYTNLKNADAWYNLNNSKEYKEMLTALKQAGEFFSTLQGKGKLDEREKEVADRLLTEIAEKAEKYELHVGAKPKNARQADRLGIVQEALKQANARFPEEQPVVQEKTAKQNEKTVSSAQVANAVKEQAPKQAEAVKSAPAQEAPKEHVEQQKSGSLDEHMLNNLKKLQSDSLSPEEFQDTILEVQTCVALFNSGKTDVTEGMFEEMKTRLKSELGLVDPAIQSAVQQKAKSMTTEGRKPASLHATIYAAVRSEENKLYDAHKKVNVPAAAAKKEKKISLPQ